VKHVGRFAATQTAISIKVARCAADDGTRRMYAHVSRRGRGLVQTVSFGTDTGCHREGLPGFQVQLYLSDVYYGGTIPQELTGQEVVNLDLYQLRSRTLAALAEMEKSKEHASYIK
jgi:hypothetical protein